MRLFRLFSLALIVSLIYVMAGCTNTPLQSSIKVHADMEESFVYDRGDAPELEVVNGVGEIIVSKADVEDINISVKGKASGENKDTCKVVLDNIYINTVNENGKFTVNVKCKDNKDLSFWDWVEEKYNSYDTSIKLDIKVPQGINIYKADLGVGNVKFEGIAGEVSINTAVGNTELSDVILTNKSIIATGTGNVSLDISDLENSEEIKVTTGVGDINVKIPEGASYTINSSGFMNNKSEEVVNGGKTAINLITSVGNITVSKK